MARDEDKATSWEGTHRQARIAASTFWLELGHLRKLIARVEDLPDTAEVTFEGLTKSYAHVDQWHAKEAHVRHQDLKRVQENPAL